MNQAPTYLVLPPKGRMTMSLRRRISEFLLAVGILAIPASAVANPGPVQSFLRGPYFQPSAATLRIFPPSGGHVMLHRDGKPVRWFINPSALTVEPGVTYAVTAVRDDKVIFDSGVVARAGILDLSWDQGRDAPSVAFHLPFATNPFNVGLVPIGTVPVQALRTPIGENGCSLMLDDLQTQLNDQARWIAFTRYTQQWLFTDAQIRAIVSSFQWPVFQQSAGQLLERRRIEQT